MKELVPVANIASGAFGLRRERLRAGTAAAIFDGLHSGRGGREAKSGGVSPGGDVNAAAANDEAINVRTRRKRAEAGARLGPLHFRP